MYKGVLKLKNPITVDKKIISEVEYNAEEITGALFAEADTKRKIDAGAHNISIVPAAEFDFNLHLYIGYAAICAANPSFSFEDASRIHGSDIVKVMDIGRNFIMQSEDSMESTSDEHTEATAEPSTQASETSNENE